MADLPQIDWAGALARARACAPFLAVALDRQPELATMLAEGQGEAALAHARSFAQGSEVGTALRRERSALAVTLAVGDLAGAFSVERVMHELSAEGPSVKLSIAGCLPKDHRASKQTGTAFTLGRSTPTHC